MEGTGKKRSDEDIGLPAVQTTIVRLGPSCHISVGLKREFDTVTRNTAKENEPKLLPDMVYAAKVVREARAGPVVLTPSRLIHPLPDCDALLQNVKQAECADMSESLASGDIRLDEPVLVTKFNPTFNMSRYVSAGGHRRVVQEIPG